MDMIEVKELLLRAIIGTKDDERRNRQDVLISFALFVDSRAAGRSDDIHQTVNYRTITKEVISLVEESEFLLIERLAEEIARICLRHEGVHKTRVSVEKPGAIRFARTVGITIERSYEDV